MPIPDVYKPLDQNILKHEQRKWTVSGNKTLPANTI